MEQLNHTVEIFCCYAHRDLELLNDLKAHLSPLQRSGLVTLWYDGDIIPGADWEEEIKLRLNRADIVLLLISADLIQSEYCYAVEMQRAVEKHQAGTTHVIPVVLRPVAWQETPIGGIKLGRLQALPKGIKAVTTWKNHDAAWKEVAEGIGNVVNKLLRKFSINQSVSISDLGTNMPVTIQIPLSQNTVDSSHPHPSNASKPIIPSPIFTSNSESFVLTHTLKGHSSEVFSIAVSPDGQILASGSWDKSIKLWKLHSGELLRTMPEKVPQTPLGEGFFSVAISPDGQILASGGKSQDIKLWDLHTGKRLRTLPGHLATDTFAVFGPDKLLLATYYYDQTVELWNPYTGNLLHTLTGELLRSITSVAFSPDGQILACSGLENADSTSSVITLWNPYTGDLLHTLTGHLGIVRSIVFSPDGQTFASGSSDCTIKIWKRATVT